MKTEKSHQEVRQWKEKIYKKNLDLSKEEVIKKTQIETTELKNSLKLSVFKPIFFPKTK